ncbi:YCII-related domain-containing protein [Nocardioides exalbidus]|uniref:YCII-related domain-containing protein n=1 Tax=Nocardioides exalbidus TaxID=402596 RepID=A0A1H4NTL8_9ACTN|nr:YciI family protein [Nocardioides exalbidus]SEB98567.1 YCII-related domain-containing protein [Nocardioides exalbidus]
MSQFLMTVHGPADLDPTIGSYGSQADWDEAFAATERYNEQLRADGHWVFAGGLESASNARVVDGQEGAPVVTDGPYLESKEYLAGFWIIEAADLDTALGLAAEASAACRGKVEVRAFDGLG